MLEQRDRPLTRRIRPNRSPSSRPTYPQPETAGLSTLTNAPPLERLRLRAPRQQRTCQKTAPHCTSREQATYEVVLFCNVRVALPLRQRAKLCPGSGAHTDAATPAAGGARAAMATGLEAGIARLRARHQPRVCDDGDSSTEFVSKLKRDREEFKRDHPLPPLPSGEADAASKRQHVAPPASPGRPPADTSPSDSKIRSGT